jgi:hypothetical protein
LLLCTLSPRWPWAVAFAQEAWSASPEQSGKATTSPVATGSIEGFRGARFGMSEQLLRQAIRRDFPAAASRLSRTTHPREKTTVLTFVVEDLLPDAGPARISYILGYASKQLIQVNIVWTSDGRTTARDQALVEAANALRNHFQAQYHPPDEIVANYPIGEHAILVFRARQPSGRMLLLLLSGVGAAGRAAADGASAPPLSLQLSYIADYANPDVFRIERGRF